MKKLPILAAVLLTACGNRSTKPQGMETTKEVSKKTDDAILEDAAQFAAEARGKLLILGHRLRTPEDTKKETKN